jgi:hypothetical protein
MTKMRHAGRTFRAIVLSVGVITFITAGLFISETAVAKGSYVSVKISPENTRFKKGGGTDSSVSKGAVKQKQPPVSKTPTPGGPVATPYPN